jgi:selenocysteine-specific elongation factor
MYVIGTAGHVDHGKSSLVQALTGIDPDRLREEKEREMTIDLGFAWLKLADGKDIGIVDVPGHRDFIENMLAGIGGIDLALFVIAADEGVMPQTREHLAILDLLEVKAGVVALTKIDLVDDIEWQELVMLDIRDSLSGTVLSEAPIVSVSSKSGEGLKSIRDAIQNQFQRIEPRPNIGRPRLPIDRVFTLTGFGTIVTGTLSGGHLDVGDLIEIQPRIREARIRGLQTHNTKLERAFPGSRVAVNLTGIRRNQVSRGDLLAAPGVATTTILCDVSYKHLRNVGTPLKHNMPVKMFTGSTEVMARTRVLAARQIDPGDHGWIQLDLQEPVAMVRGDRFILRRPSPPATIGGGHILDPHPGRKHRRFKTDIAKKLEMLEQGTPADLLLEAIYREQPSRLESIAMTAGMSVKEAEQALQELLLDDRAEMVGTFILPASGREQWKNKLISILERYHSRAPLRLGMPREEVRSRLSLPADFFNHLIDWVSKSKSVVASGAIVRLEDHVIEFSQNQQAGIKALMDQFERAGVNSPNVKDCKAQVGEDVYVALIESQLIVQISDDVVYASGEYDVLVSRIVSYLKDNDSIDAAKLRDLFGTSRKYAIALLEHLDQIRVTKRVGDIRTLSFN